MLSRLATRSSRSTLVDTTGSIPNAQVSVLVIVLHARFARALVLASFLHRNAHVTSQPCHPNLYSPPSASSRCCNSCERSQLAITSRSPLCARALSSISATSYRSSPHFFACIAHSGTHRARQNPVANDIQVGWKLDYRFRQNVPRAARLVLPVVLTRGLLPPCTPV